jgi:hypothetical protein
MWAVFFLVSSGLCVHLLLESTLEFFSYKVKTNIEVVNDSEANFPVVSICNLNPFKTHDPKIHKELHDILESPKFNYSYVRSFYVPMLTVKSVAKYLKVYIANKTRNERRRYGHEFNEMSIDCLFNTSPCSKNNETIKIEWFHHFEYGNCFKITGLKNQELKTTKNGYKGGLQLELYIGNSSLYEPFTNKRGLRVLINNITDNSNDLEDHGIDVPAGFMTNIAVKRTFFERLDYPYSNCVKDLTQNNPYQTETIKSMFENLNITVYSQQLCEKYRYNQLLFEKCNCVDPAFTYMHKNKTEVETCVTPVKVICSEEWFIKYHSKSRDRSECPQECSYIEYSYKISQSNFITEWYLDLLKHYFSNPNKANLFSKNIRPKLHLINNLSEARKDLVALNIFYEKNDYTLITQTPLWNINTLLSNYGGEIGIRINQLKVYHICLLKYLINILLKNVGLFLGMSVLSLVEIIEIILITLYVVWKHFTKK